MLGIGETAEHVGNDLEFSKLLGRIVAQTLAGEIPYTFITEARGLMSPLVRATILYGHRDRVRLAAGHRALFTRCLIVFARVVVQYGLPGARADIQPPVRAAKPAESIAEPGGKKLRVAREPAVGDVAAGNIGAAAAVDFFLLANFLVDARVEGVPVSRQLPA